MAKKPTKSNAKTKKVIISSSNVKERNSRNSLELHISPWVCIPTNGSNDHGYDYTVEIVSKAGLDDYTPDGRFFLVQLKSQSKLTRKNGVVVPHPIETKKIQQWFRSSTQIPFLYIVNDLVKGTFYYQWIDELFISALEKEAPFWTNQDKITIKIPYQNELFKGENTTIRDYVYNHKYTSTTLLEPGIFFALKDKIRDTILSYENLIVTSPFESVKKDVARLKSDLENAAYRIAISGLSRVGKSSLVNKLLKRADISPTDVWQTTGVPIIIQPGKDERVIINFHGKPSESYPYSADIIKKYATREFNEENHKGVRDVSVFISSPQLERGVMFYDIPGLDDPNDTIMEFAHHTAECANVVLYLIDGSSARSGGFVFKNDYKKHIENFSKTSNENVFLVITKVDELSLDKLRDLKKEIEKNLEKYKLKNKVHAKVYYLPINPNVANTENLESIQPGINSLQELDHDLWAFMLEENKVGLVKFYMLLKDLHDSQKNLVQILRARVLDANNKKQLVLAINGVKQKIRNLERHIHQQKSEIVTSISKNLQIRKNGIVAHLKAELLKLQDMPHDDTVKNYLAKKGYNAVTKTQEDMGMQLTQLKDYLETWIKENLDPVQGIINIESKTIDYPLKGMEDIKFPDIDFSSVWGKGIFLTLAGIVITSIPGFGFVIGAGSVFLDLIFGKEERHANRVGKVIDKVDTVYSKAFADAEFQFKEIVDEQIKALIEYINRKLNLYFLDIEGQVNRYDLSSNFDYIAFEKRAEHQIQEIQGQIDDIWKELQGHLAATKLLS